MNYGWCSSFRTDSFRLKQEQALGFWDLVQIPDTTNQFLPLWRISWMSEETINYSTICMPSKVFCILRISKQSLKPWYYWKIPTNLHWMTIICVGIASCLPYNLLFVHHSPQCQGQLTFVAIHHAISSLCKSD